MVIFDSIKIGRRGQIWVETVVYTLIGISLIGLVLAIVTPKINEYKDRTIIEQSIDSLSVFDSKIKEVLQAPGNKRKVEMGLKRGDFYINAYENKTWFELADSRSKYSEPGESIYIGRINLTTQELTKRYKVILEIYYPQYDITFDNLDSPENKKFSSASVPYQFFIENKGFDDDGKLQIDVTEG